jgi:hypothetical protein
MFDLSNHRDYSDYDRWLNTFTEASARLDALQTAVTDLRHLLRTPRACAALKSSKCLNGTADNTLYWRGP